METPKNSLTSFSEHLNQHYGKIGTEKRDKYEIGFELFKLSALLLDLRKEKGLSQEELAKRSGTTIKNIAKIENNADEVKLSLLRQVMQDGLGVNIKISIES